MLLQKWAHKLWRVTHFQMASLGLSLRMKNVKRRGGKKVKSCWDLFLKIDDVTARNSPIITFSVSSLWCQ